MDAGYVKRCQPYSRLGVVAVLVILGFVTLTQELQAKSKQSPVQDFVFFKQVTSAIASNPKAMAVGDLNGDGRMDIAVHTTSTGTNEDTDYTIMVYYQDKSGDLSEPYSYQGRLGTDIKIADLNGDGLNDLVIPSQSGFAILYNQGKQEFARAVVPAGYPCTRLAVGDLTADGRPDVVTIDTSLATDQVRFYRQQTDGGFTRETLTFLPASDVTIADINADHFDDLLVLGRNGRVGIKYQTSPGVFTPARYLDPGEEVEAKDLHVADMNGDGVLDVVVLSQRNQSESAVMVYMGTQGGEPSLQHSLTTLPNGIAVCAVDLNLDARPELVTLYENSTELAIFMQLADGSFSSEELHEVPDTGEATASCLVSADLNLDGSPDLVTLSPISGTTILYQRNRILIPHIATSSAWNTHLVLDNVGNTYADVVIAMYNEDRGDDYQAYFVYPNESLHVELPAGTCGAITYAGGKIVARETFENTEPDGGGLAEFLLDGRSAPDFTIPLPAYNGENLTWMGIAIFNPTETDAAATLTAVDENGSILGTAEVSVHAHQRIVGILDSLFPGIDMLRTARVDVSSDQSLTGIAISGNGNEKLLFSRAALDTAGGTLLLPHYARQSQGWDTLLVLDNTSGVEQTITLTLVGAGVTLDSFLLRVPANSSRTFNLNNLASDPESVEAGWLSVPDGVIAREAFLNTEPDGGGTAQFRLTGVTTPFLVLNYPSYAMDLITWRGIAVFNPTDAHQTVRIWLYANNSWLRTTTVEIDPLSRYRVVLEDLFPGIEDDPVSTVTLEGSGPLSGLNISGAGTARLLFSPATPR